jgi:hypothetical protein
MHLTVGRGFGLAGAHLVPLWEPDAEPHTRALSRTDSVADAVADAAADCRAFGGADDGVSPAAARA